MQKAVIIAVLVGISLQYQKIQFAKSLVEGMLNASFDTKNKKVALEDPVEDVAAYTTSLSDSDPPQELVKGFGLFNYRTLRRLLIVVSLTCISYPGPAGWCHPVITDAQCGMACVKTMKTQERTKLAQIGTPAVIVVSEARPGMSSRSRRRALQSALYWLLQREPDCAAEV